MVPIFYCVPIIRLGGRSEANITQLGEVPVTQRREGEITTEEFLYFQLFSTDPNACFVFLFFSLDNLPFPVVCAEPGAGAECAVREQHWEGRPCYVRQAC